MNFDWLDIFKVKCTLQVLGMGPGELCNWKKIKCLDLVTVSTESLFYTRNCSLTNNNPTYLLKAQISQKSSSFHEKEELIGYSSMIVNHECQLVTISKNGALQSLKKEEECGGSKLFPDKALAYLCRYCLKICRDSQKARHHISSQHSGPVSCERCDRSQEDLHELTNHKKSCVFSCGVVGCLLVHKTEKSATNHKMKYLKSIS